MKVITRKELRFIVSELKDANERLNDRAPETSLEAYFLRNVVDRNDAIIEKLESIINNNDRRIEVKEDQQ